MDRERPLKFVRRDKRRELESARRSTLAPPRTPAGYEFIDGGLQEYENRFFWKRGRMMEMVQEAYKRHLKEGKADPVRVLDFGCGQNQAMRDLYRLNKKFGPTLKVVGVSAGDPRTAEQKNFDEWEPRGNITFINRQYRDFENPEQGASERFDLGSNGFDIIVSQVTFQHLYDPFAEMKMLYRALRPGGEMHIRLPMGFLGRKFAEGEEGNGMAQACLESAREVGVHIEVDVGGDIRIVKNDKRLVFPRLRYRTVGPRSPRERNTTPIYQLESPGRHMGRKVLRKVASALQKRSRK